jgi:hypothetical protein
VKTEHVTAIVSFVRRLQLSDLMLPAGAALVSAGLQKLVDRETVQRRRLAALAELVDDHRTTLEANGVELPVDRFGDETHPLDVEGAIEVILLRAPTQPEATGETPPRPRRLGGTIAVLGAVGIVAGAVWANSAGYLRGFADVAGANRRVQEAAAATRVCLRCGAPLDEDGICSTRVDGEHPETSETANRAMAASDVYNARAEQLDGELLEAAAEGEPLETRPPLEMCGWPGCTWTSQPDRPELSQRTAAAVHRNRCIHRPAGAQVDG